MAHPAQLLEIRHLAFRLSPCGAAIRRLQWPRGVAALEKQTRERWARRKFLKSGASLAALTSAALPSAVLPASMILSVPAISEEPSATRGIEDRAYWVQILARVAEPVLRALSERKLKAEMPVEAAPGLAGQRRQFTHLEAMGRLLAGIAPWLESGIESGLKPGLESGPNAGAEGKLRSQYAEWSRMGLQSATDPGSPDYMNFNQGGQPVVDAAFLALAIIRAPNELWRKLDAATQRHLVAALEATRVIQPGYSNWLLFSAMIEAALSTMGAWWDPMRVDYAVRSLNAWYKGDGVYGDGPEFHWDYYSSFVMHPMLLHVLDTASRSSHAWDSFKPAALERARRYAAIQERVIAPDGTFPAIGRSLCYRFGAFHLLAEMALRRELPEGVSAQQVRCALTAVMRRMIDAPGTFDEHGWLQVGFYGHQPSIAETYISTGSCYLCSAAWLPLGLPESDPFWVGAKQPWTSQKIWSGEAIPPDHAIAEMAAASRKT